MKRYTIIYTIILSALIPFAAPLDATGCAAGTLVKTAVGYAPIESLEKGDVVLCSNFNDALVEKPITRVIKRSVKNYVRITINDAVLALAPDHKLYLPRTKTWVDAAHLAKSHLLLRNSCGYTRITDAVIVDEPIDVYDITVADYHNFCVSRHDVVVHNFIPLAIGVGFVFGGGAIEFAGVSFAALATTAVCFVVKALTSHNTVYEIPDDDLFLKKEQDKKEAKDKSEDASYHHRNSNGRKSPGPKDSQKALDKAVSVEGSNSKVSVCDNEIVIFNQTANGIYHGHVRTWKELQSAGKFGQKIINTLIKYGLANRAGKLNG